MADHLPKLRTPQLPMERECWGWEYRDMRLPPMVPQGQPPALDVPAPELGIRAGRINRTRGWAGLLTVGAAAAIPATWLLLGPFAALAPAAVASGLAWVAFVQPTRLLGRVDSAYAEWVCNCEQAHAQFRQQVAAWSTRRTEDERRYVADAACPPWTPLGPVPTARVDVYGGTDDGWQHLLLHAGSSLLAAGTQLTVLDLTGDRVAGPLGGRSLETRVDRSWLTCPVELTSVNMLAGLSATEVGVVISEAVHASRSASEDYRSTDADLIKRIATELTDQPVTVDRLHAALDVLLMNVPHSATVRLTPAEGKRVVGLFGDTSRRSAEPRIYQLAADLAALATTGADSDVSQQGLFEAERGLRVVELVDHGGRFANDLFAQVLFQILVLRLPGRSGHAAVVIAGADRLRRDDVERLDQLARSRGIRLILLFRHLREGATDLIGGGDAVIFMRLGNASEAENAERFIGREYRFVASQFTVSHSDNESSSVSGGVTDSTIGPRSTTFGIQSQQGVTTSESVGYQRVHEHTVSATLLQRLSSTAYVMVDPRDPGSPRLGDCNPAITAETEYAGGDHG